MEQKIFVSWIFIENKRLSMQNQANESPQYCHLNGLVLC